MLVGVSRKGSENRERGGKKDMGAKDESKREGYKTDATGKKMDAAVNRMPRATSVDDLFAPLSGLNVRASGEAHQSSTNSAAQSSQASHARHTGGEVPDAALPLSQSTSDDEQQTGPGLDERKQKRMLSNRESARRSRLRKQQHLDELRAQVAQLRAENTDMMARYGTASQQYSQVTGENVVLRAHATDLSRKLHQVQQELATQHFNSLRPLGIRSIDQFAVHLSPFLQP